MNFFSGKHFVKTLFCGLIVALFSFVAEARFQRAEIKKTVAKTEMRLAGAQSFSAVNAQSGTIEWRVDRLETDETSSETVLIKDVATATGTKVTFNLPKISGKETVYQINARGKNFELTQNVQVFEPETASSFIFKSAGNPDVQCYIVVPKTLSPKTRIIVVMSGLNRNSDEYISSWTDWAARHDYIAVSPTFDEKNWGGSRGYNLGNVFTEDEGKGEMNARSKWSFTVVEGIHQKLRADFGIADARFDIFGHSAGAQFVHRLMLFNPEAKVRFALAANAGWFTLPDLNAAFSYGLKHPQLSFTKKNLLDWTRRPVILMRGTADTSRAGALRKTPEADAQGQNRFERAAFMFNRIKAVNSKTQWRLIDVPKVGHDQKLMALAAQDFLVKADRKK